MSDLMNDGRSARRLKIWVGLTILIAAGIYAAVWAVQSAGAS